MFNGMLDMGSLEHNKCLLQVIVLDIVEINTMIIAYSCSNLDLLTCASFYCLNIDTFIKAEKTKRVELILQLKKA